MSELLNLVGHWELPRVNHLMGVLNMHIMTKNFKDMNIGKKPQEESNIPSSKTANIDS